MAKARMGFVGYVKWIPKGGTTQTIIRATSADVKLTQEISYPDVVDGKIDQTVYQLGPQVTGGNIAFPLLHEMSPSVPPTQGGAACGNNVQASLAGTLWQYAAQRDRLGRMEANNVFDCAIRYADNLGYVYYGCMVNTMTFTMNKSEPVNVSCEVIGGAGDVPVLRKTLDTANIPNVDTLQFLSPVRNVTWNDVGIGTWNDTGEPLINTGEVTEFGCTINNNIERIYSLNGKLGPVDIVAKKREISGTMKMLGGQYNLSQLTENNQNAFTSNSGIAFGFRLGQTSGTGDTGPFYWATGLWGCVFEIEEVALGNGLFETSTKWRALGDCDNNHLATAVGQGVASLVRPSTGAYGASTATAYPSFDPYSAG